MVDATTLTEAGYVGEDVENILLRLLQGIISHSKFGINPWWKSYHLDRIKYPIKCRYDLDTSLSFNPLPNTIQLLK